jgi:hypothetical protein
MSKLLLIAYLRQGFVLVIGYIYRNDKIESYCLHLLLRMMLLTGNDGVLVKFSILIIERQI